MLCFLVNFILIILQQLYLNGSIYLLKPDKYKDIIISSLEFLVKEKRIKVYGFAIMSNHIHVIWQIQIFYKKDP